ncbi:MAG: ABC transporter substrate-binding protein [Proteobacteria bacterium]|nr:ABC transporter substrate-binding protein [Pseudomonadota bacterium]
MKRIGHIAVFITVLVLGNSVAAAQASPTAFLRSNDRKLNPLLTNVEKNRGKIVKIVNKMLDFKTLCRTSLGKHWDARSESERREFTETLQALIEKSLIGRLKDSKDRVTTYESEKVYDDTASVVTLITTGNDPRAEKTEIEYKLQKQAKAWGVVDMVTDGVSLVSNYKSQFNKIIKKDGWDALMKKMKDKLAK